MKYKTRNNAYVNTIGINKFSTEKKIHFGFGITFKDKDGLIITHRAVASFVDTRGGIYYETKGDNNKTIDPNPLPEENIITIFVKRIL